MVAYIRVSLPAIPFWRTYTVLETPKGELAVASDGGVLYRTKIKAVRRKLREFLAGYVYRAPLWRVLLWPLIGFAIVLAVLAKVASTLDGRNNGERLIQGAPIVSHWRWNLPLLFRRPQRGFYIETK